MSLFNVGRVCLKIAGRDAGKRCVIVEQLDNTYVLVDGGVRRKKVNVKHLELLPQTLEIKSGASHETVQKAFAELGWEVWEKKSKPATERLKKQKKVKEQKSAVKETKKKEKTLEAAEKKEEKKTD